MRVETGLDRAFCSQVGRYDVCQGWATGGGVLGSWKSNTVLIYAEEALEEIPANQRLLPGSGFAATTRLSCWKAPKAPRTPGADMGDDVPIPMTPHSTSPPTPSKVVDEQQGSKDAAIVSCLTFDRPRELWVYSIRDNRKDPTLHLVAAAGWEMPMSEWKTACGWPFARNEAEAAFSYVRNLTRKKCRKCILNKSKRDGVSEVDIGRLRASSFAGALVQNGMRPASEYEAAPPTLKSESRAEGWEVMCS